MTGWQGSGGWGPQQDPHGGQSGQYGADPSGTGQYGVDPYGQQQQYGADPYGQQQQQYGADPYGQQYGGYPGYAQPGFEPPKRSKLPIVLSLVAILAVVGTVVTIVLLNRDDSSASGTGATSSPSRPPATGKPSGSANRSSLPPPSPKSVPKEGWTTVEVSVASYQVPPEWKRDSKKRPSGLGIDFDRGAVVGSYACEGSNYNRGFAAFGEAQSKNGAALDVNKTIADFSNSFAREYFGDTVIAEVGKPKEAKTGEVTGATVTAKLTVTPTKPACEATSGEVAIFGVPVEKDGAVTAVRMLVVVVDLGGGPADPPGVPDEIAEEILTTLTLK